MGQSTRWTSALAVLVTGIAFMACEHDNRCELTATCPFPEDAGTTKPTTAPTDDDDDDGAKPSGNADPSAPSSPGSQSDGAPEAEPSSVTSPGLLVPLPPGAPNSEPGTSPDGGGSSSFDAAAPSSLDASDNHSLADSDPGIVVPDQSHTDDPSGSDAGDVPEVDPCTENNGGCDALAECSSSPSGAECGACQEGYAGDGTTGCAPTLLAVSLSHGTLTPELEPGLNEYDVSVPVFIESVTLALDVPVGATATIRGAAVASGSQWTSPHLDLGLNVFSIVVERQGQPSSTYVLNVSRGASATAYIKASNTRAGDLFGSSSVALSADGTTLAVAALGEDSSATGVGSDENNDDAPEAGAVYVFIRRDDTWSQQAYIKASNAEEGDNFGSSLALSADGATLVVGSAFEDSNATGTSGAGQDDNTTVNAGAVYVFSRSGSGWSQQGYLKASNTDAGDRFGRSVSLSADGETLAVGAPMEDSSSMGTTGSGQGNNDAADAGAVYVFNRNGTEWTEQAYLKASNTNANDQFGGALALSADASTLAVGAIGEDSGATGINGDQGNDDGTRSAGATYILVRNGNAWTQQAYVKASNTDANDGFGWSVALSANGDVLAVGAEAEGSSATGIDGDQGNNDATNAGAAYVFVRGAADWAQDAYIKPTNASSGDRFGCSVGLSSNGNTLVVGAINADGNPASVAGDGSVSVDVANVGLVYVFARTTRGWNEHASVRATNAEPFESFGSDVAISADGNTLAISSPLEDSSTTGTSGTAPADNEANSAGAVYVYR